MHVVACVRIAFLRSSNIPLYEQTILFLHSSVGPGCSYHLAIVNSAAVHTAAWTSVWACCQLLWGVHLGVELVGHNGNSVKLLEEPSNFSTKAAPFYIPTSNVRGFQFLPSLTSTFF